MKRLFFIVIAAALLWSGYWVIGARSLSGAVTDWFEARRDEGWVADYDSFAVRGFPNRFDATWTDLTLADPDTGVAWTMPRFAMMALSYQPDRIIAAWPDRMQLSTPADRIDLTSDRLRASLNLKAGTTQLERAIVEGLNIGLSGAESGRVAELHLAAERTGEASYRLGLDARDVTPPAPMLRDMLGDQALPETMQMARLDAVATFDRPWDQSALDVSRPQPTRIDITLMEAEWGAMQLRATGALDVDPTTARARGTLRLQADNWQEILDIAAASGAIGSTEASAVRSALQLIAGTSGNPSSIDVDLSFRGAMMYLGPVPIGAAPYFFLR